MESDRNSNIRNVDYGVPESANQTHRGFQWGFVVGFSCAFAIQFIAFVAIALMETAGHVSASRNLLDVLGDTYTPGKRLVYMLLPASWGAQGPNIPLGFAVLAAAVCAYSTTVGLISGLCAAVLHARRKCSDRCPHGDPPT